MTSIRLRLRLGALLFLGLVAAGRAALPDPVFRPEHGPVDPSPTTQASLTCPLAWAHRIIMCGQLLQSLGLLSSLQGPTNFVETDTASLTPPPRREASAVPDGSGEDLPVP